MRISGAEFSVQVGFGQPYPEGKPDTMIVFDGGWAGDATLDDLVDELDAAIRPPDGQFVPYELRTEYYQSNWNASALGLSVVMLISDRVTSLALDRMVDKILGVISGHAGSTQLDDQGRAQELSRTRITTHYDVDVADLRLVFDGKTERGWKFEWESADTRYEVEVFRNWTTLLGRRRLG